MLYVRDGGGADDEPRGRRRLRIQAVTHASELQVEPPRRMFEENLLGFPHLGEPPKRSQQGSPEVHRHASRCCGAEAGGPKGNLAEEQ